MLPLGGLFVFRYLPSAAAVPPPCLPTPCRFGLQLGSNAVVTNGRVITVSPSEPFSLPDFQLAEQFALRFQMSAEAVQLAVQAAPGEVADVAMVVSSVLAAHQPDEVSGTAAVRICTASCRQASTTWSPCIRHQAVPMC